MFVDKKVLFKMKNISITVTALFVSIDHATAFMRPAPPYMVKPKPHEYQNWLPDHPGHGHFHRKNNSMSPWHPYPHHPPHYSPPRQCSMSGEYPPQGDFWLPNFHGVYQGTSPFLANGSNYEVFRDVKDFGAVGDGKTDDTKAINNAIACESSATSM